MASGRPRTVWTREQTYAAFALYMRMPPGRLSYEEDSRIIAFAGATGKSEGSVAIKLQNILAYDPNATRKGFPNAAKLIPELWDEYAERGLELVAEFAAAYDNVMSVNGSSTPKIRMDYEPREGADKVVESTRRLNQDYFRHSLLDLYGYRCCVTDLGVPQLLVASHIKPWKAADPHAERINVENGILLNSLHDRAFDKGLITLDSDYRIVMSEELRRRFEKEDSEGLRWLWSTRGRKIRLPKKHRPNPDFITYHQDEVFLG